MLVSTYVCEGAATERVVNLVGGWGTHTIIFVCVIIAAIRVDAFSDPLPCEGQHQ